jgi:uncharacterized protein YjdB
MSSVLVTFKSTTPTLAEVEASAKEAGLNVNIVSPILLDVYSLDVDAITKWTDLFKDNVNLELDITPIIMAPRCSVNKNHTNTLKPRSTNVPYFYMNEIRSIYKIPSPNTSTAVCVGVVSFGGGLYGNVAANGVLTGGDVQAYWTAIGITPPNHPRVIVVPLFGATNTPNANDGGATFENTLDVETIGGACPSPNLTIILYISPNSLGAFPGLLNYIYNTPVVVNSVSYKPTIVSISWGAPEIYFGSSLISSINSNFLTMINSGMNVLTATGDNGSNNGVGGSANYVDYPSASPNVTAVGGTTLYCPNNVYDTFTNETAWSSGGGGISSLNPKPTYQSAITGAGRSSPDIAAVADPNTGVVFIVNGYYEIIGGTSVAAPIIGGFLAAINYNSFINPKLYVAPSNCFNDILTGSNGGFSAHAGYDNCTGFGSFNGLNLAGALNNVIATSITIAPTSLVLQIGQVSTLVRTILPNNVTITTVTWSSSNSLVAIVNNGVVTAVSSGSATISVATTDGSNLSSSIQVTVATPTTIVPVTGVTLNQSAATLHVTNTVQLAATVVPANATTQTVSWSSLNTAVATVNQSGLVSANALGQATIRVTTTDGSKIANASISVTIPVTSITLSMSSAAITVGQVRSVTATVRPTNAPNRAVTWTSANSAIASVTSNGVILGVNNGTTTITATTNDMGLQASVIVTVFTRVRNVAISPSTDLALNVGQTSTLTRVITPATASNQTVTWASTSNSVATVSNVGLVTAVGNGSCIISVTTQDGNKYASLVARVRRPVTGVSLNFTTVTMARNSSRTLLPSVTPNNASNINVTWSTSNGLVATVNSRGVVKAVRTGTATITVRTVDGNFPATCVVTVT